MSTTGVRSDDASGIASVKDVDLKLEAVVIPVSDVDRAKEFYGSLGWRLDADFPFDNGFRVVQVTPPARGIPLNPTPGTRWDASPSHQNVTGSPARLSAARTACPPTPDSRSVKLHSQR